MSSRARAVLGLVAVAAAIAVVVGAVLASGEDGFAPVAAVAAVQDDYLPVKPLEEIPARLDLIAETGATATRVDLFWGDIAPSRPARPRDPTDPAYDFSRADLIVRGLAERGITPMVAVYDTPAWSTGGRSTEPETPFNRLTPDPEDFGDFMGALARRYAGDLRGPGGDLLPEVRHYEIWNEPNLSGFLTPQFEGETPVSPDAYAAMVEAAYPRIKSANPDARVIAGVAGPRGTTGPTGIGAIDWLRHLRDRDIPLDAWSQHVYPVAGPLEPTAAVPSWSTIGRFLDELDGFQPGLPLYITEAGYTTAETEYRDPRSAVSEDDQARYLAQIYSLPQLRADRIRTVVWFNLQDNVAWPAGLLREDGSRKPSYERFRDVVRGQEGSRLRD
jgi:hypothetical protein